MLADVSVEGWEALGMMVLPRGRLARAGAEVAAEEKMSGLWDGKERDAVSELGSLLYLFFTA